MRRTLIAFIALSSMIATLAEAQRGRFPRGGRLPRGGSSADSPKWWGSLWGGYQWSDPVNDGKSGATWNFDAGWGFRGTLERDMGRGTAIGVAFNYVRMPLTFLPVAAPGGGPRCTVCDATATIASYGLLLRSGGGRGLHPVFEGFAGAMQFSHFDFDVPAEQPRDEISNTDFAFSLGTGFGYTLSNDFQLIALYDWGNNVHERATQSNGRRVSQHHATRIGVRVGF